MKQTAVEFLVKGLPMVYWEDSYYSDLLEQAKEMEKQQIIDAIYNAQKTDFYVKYYNVEQYIDEIFKNK
jgi:hypothetical protein